MVDQVNLFLYFYTNSYYFRYHLMIKGNKTYTKHIRYSHICSFFNFTKPNLLLIHGFT